MTSMRDVIPADLVSPPEAQTDTTIAVVWTKPEHAHDIASYKVFVNGEMEDSCRCTDYTITGLESDKEYRITVRSCLKNGELSLESNCITVRTKPEPDVFDIRVFGAVGNGTTLNTEAIQNAIDACASGGKVYVPEGVFRTGAIYLKSNMTLYVEKGGILLGSEHSADYPLTEYRWEGKECICYSSLVNTKPGEHVHITIAGEGTIDANGSVLRQKELEEGNGSPGRAVCIRNTTGVYLKDITIRQSPAWCTHLIYCSGISVNHVNVHSKYDENGQLYEGIANGDGLNPDSCREIYIFNSMISSQDDCIAIKSGRDEEGRKVGKPTENVRITNCTFKSGFGVAIGSEMAGSVRNVLVQDCEFEDVYSIGSIKAPRGRGGIVENICYEDITFRNSSYEHEDCKWFRGAIYIDQFYSHDTFDLSRKEESWAGTSVIRNICFRNISLETVAGNAIYIAGLPESPLQSIYLENISAKGKYGCKIYNTNEITLKNVKCISEEDQDFILQGVEKVL